MVFSFGINIANMCQKARWAVLCRFDHLQPFLLSLHATALRPLEELLSQAGFPVFLMGPDPGPPVGGRSRNGDSMAEAARKPEAMARGARMLRTAPRTRHRRVSGRPDDCRGHSSIPTGGSGSTASPRGSPILAPRSRPPMASGSCGSSPIMLEPRCMPRARACRRNCPRPGNVSRGFCRPWSPRPVSRSASPLSRSSPWPTTSIPGS